MENKEMEKHLDSKCAAVCKNTRCAWSVRQSPTGRWFITIGHAGFNSPANNRDGYATQDSAYTAAYRYLNAGVR